MNVDFYPVNFKDLEFPLSENSGKACRYVNDRYQDLGRCFQDCDCMGSLEDGQKVVVQNPDRLGLFEGRLFVSSGASWTRKGGNILGYGLDWIPQMLSRNVAKYIRGHEASGEATLRYLQKVNQQLNKFVGEMESLTRLGRIPEFEKNFLLEQLQRVAIAARQERSGLSSLAFTYSREQKEDLSASCFNTQKSCDIIEKRVKELMREVEALFSGEELSSDAFSQSDSAADGSSDSVE